MQLRNNSVAALFCLIWVFEMLLLIFLLTITLLNGMIVICYFLFVTVNNNFSTTHSVSYPCSQGKN